MGRRRRDLHARPPRLSPAAPCVDTLAVHRRQTPARDRRDPPYGRARRGHP